MKKFNIIIGILIVIVASTIIACASKPKPAQKNEAEVKVNEVKVGEKDVPEFFLNPPKSGDIIYGVGTAKLQKLDASRRAAVASARDDIAFQVNTRVKTSLTNYYQESGADNKTQLLEFVESVSKQIADVTLIDLKVEKVFPGSDGTLYALVSYPKSNMLKDVEKVFARNEDAAFAEFKAREAVARLDKEMTDNPTQAGQKKE